MGLRAGSRGRAGHASRERARRRGRGAGARCAWVWRFGPGQAGAWERTVCLDRWAALGPAGAARRKPGPLPTRDGHARVGRIARPTRARPPARLAGLNQPTRRAITSESEAVSTRDAPVRALTRVRFIAAFDVSSARSSFTGYFFFRTRPLDAHPERHQRGQTQRRSTPRRQFARDRLAVKERGREASHTTKAAAAPTLTARRRALPEFSPVRVRGSGEPSSGPLQPRTPDRVASNRQTGRLSSQPRAGDFR